MTTITDPPKTSFRPSMLIYDTRYRSATIQIAALVGFLLLASWLISNTAQNLAALGKPIDFGFLMTSSNYDINQTLIAYTSRSTHLRAAFVGLINTLIIAALGCALATILGVVIGVLRLSKNWIVGTLTAIYVEMFRNVPVLLWIVFSMAVLIESFPAPNAFRGEDPAASMLFGGSVALTNRGFYIPEPLFSRGPGDISVFGLFEVSLELVALLAVLAAGIWAARRVTRRADAIQARTGARPATWHIRTALIVLPPLALLWLFGFHLANPELQGFNFQGGTYLRNSLIALWLALSFYTAAFIAEIVRAGILAVSRGQSEAAFALGLRPNATMRLVILPQALRVIIPPLISQYLNLTKNSSLAIAVGYMDITGTLGNITRNQTGRELETVLLLMLVYLAISLSISSVMNWYNTRVRLVER